MSVKILVCGDVRGKFKFLFDRVGDVNSKAGPFAALFCVGRFFDPDEPTNKQLQPYLQGTSSIAIPVYFICGAEDSSTGATSLINELPNGGQLCPNLTYLGRSGVTEIAGLQVAYLSGIYDPYKYSDDGKSSTWRKLQYEPHYYQLDLEAITRVADELPNGLDVLLTCEWGEGFNRLLEGESPALKTNMLSLAVGRLSSAVSARYHFAGTEDAYFKLPPFANNLHSTRFYGLGTVGNKSVKFLEALNVTPVSGLSKEELEKQQAGTTPNPYTYVAPPPKMTEAEEAELRKAEIAEHAVKMKELFEAASQAHAAGDGARAKELSTEGHAEKALMLAAQARAAATTAQTGVGMHEELEDGRWRCGLCGNVNLKHQKKQCNMRSCQAPRNPGEAPEPPRQVGVTTKEEAIAAAEEAAAREAKKKEPKRVSLYINQRPQKKKTRQ